ncbi:MAG TPA: hypothetical protein VGD79_13420, partial [Thermoanaerobaculia bacterium]
MSILPALALFPIVQLTGVTHATPNGVDFRTAVDKPPFAQTFVGAVLAAVLAGLVVWFVTSRQPVRLEVTAASLAAPSDSRQPEDSNKIAPSTDPTPS